MKVLKVMKVIEDINLLLWTVELPEESCNMALG